MGGFSDASQKFLQGIKIIHSKSHMTEHDFVCWRPGSGKIELWAWYLSRLAAVVAAPDVANTKRNHCERVGDDPHPIKLSDADDDFWLVQAHSANMLLDAPGFSAVIVASNGTMARMNTVHPATFVTFKRWLANQVERDALKRRGDVLQAVA
jgi:hypothetical protein